MPRRGAVVLRIIESESALHGPLSPSSGTIHAIGPVDDVHTPPVDTRGELYAESSLVYGQIIGELSSLAKSHIRPYMEYRHRRSEGAYAPLGTLQVNGK